MIIGLVAKASGAFHAYGGASGIMPMDEPMSEGAVNEDQDE